MNVMPRLKSIQRMFLMESISKIDLSLDTELLRSFVAITNTGGFTRAVKTVNRTWSA